LPDPVEEPESEVPAEAAGAIGDGTVEGADAVDLNTAELPDPVTEPTSEPIDGDDAADPDADEGANAPDPGAEPGREPAEVDDDVDPDTEELAPLWSAGFNQLPTSRPQQPSDNANGPRAAMPAPRRGVVDIQIPLTTLLGLTDFPGDLAGFGPVIADIARQVVAEQPDATWRFSIYDQLGELISHGITRRRPTAQDAAFIKARDRTCRAPGCRVAARHCDIDHTDDWASSKDSRRCNLACLCRKHHLFKHLTGCDLIQIRPGILGWTTPLGQRHVTRPEPYPDELILQRHLPGDFAAAGSSVV
jgi:hypothetical protein